MFRSLRGYRREWVRGDLQRSGAEDEAAVFPTVEDAVSRVR